MKQGFAMNRQAGGGGGGGGAIVKSCASGGTSPAFVHPDMPADHTIVSRLKRPSPIIRPRSARL